MIETFSKGMAVVIISHTAFAIWTTRHFFIAKYLKGGNVYNIGLIVIHAMVAIGFYYMYLGWREQRMEVDE